MQKKVESFTKYSLFTESKGNVYSRIIQTFFVKNTNKCYPRGYVSKDGKASTCINFISIFHHYRLLLNTLPAVIHQVESLYWFVKI